MKMKINYNNITREEFFKLNEDDLMLITNPGRMGDEDGSTFVIKKDDEYIVYRVSGWMYGNKDEDFISHEEMFNQFKKWREVCEHSTNEKYEGKYVYVYMGLGNGLCVDKSISDEYLKCLEEVASQDSNYYIESNKYGVIFSSWESALINYLNSKNINLYNSVKE